MKVMAVIHQDRNDWMIHLRMILRSLSPSGWMTSN